jgi:hypothetical protein
MVIVDQFGHRHDIVLGCQCQNAGGSEASIWLLLSQTMKASEARVVLGGEVIGLRHSHWQAGHNTPEAGAP